MPLVSFGEMLSACLKHGYAVGYFEAWNQDSIEAVLSAADEADSPVIIGFGGMTVDQEWFEEWGLESLAAMGRTAVAKSGVPVCYLLNETKTIEQSLRGIELGFNVVMTDTSYMSFSENVRVTRELARAAHAEGVAVEGELGRLPEAGAQYEGFLTDPGQAGEFVSATGVDALSVSIGNVHMLDAEGGGVDLELLGRIGEQCPVPLVIHGGSGFPADLVQKCIGVGVAKFNVGTVLKKQYLAGIREGLKSGACGGGVQALVGSRKKSDFTHPAKERIKKAVKEKLRLYGSPGMSQCGRLPG